MKMIEFPKGAVLIPNPVNQIPGFSIANGHFLPGFPSMAEPMTIWVLDTYYEKGEARVRRTLNLPGAREADLVPFMEAFIKSHPALSFSSLPRFVKGGTEVEEPKEGDPKTETTADDWIPEMGRPWDETKDDALGACVVVTVVDSVTSSRLAWVCPCSR